jgi:methyl-accepting chemotaxis protein WspA
MDQMREVVSRMEVGERNLLQTRSQTAETTARQTLDIVMYGMPLGILVLS